MQAGRLAPDLASLRLPANNAGTMEGKRTLKGHLRYLRRGSSRKGSKARRGGYVIQASQASITVAVLL